MAELESGGLSYASRHYAKQRAKVHTLQLVLRGKWELAEDTPSVGIRIKGNETLLELNCKDGLTEQVDLVSVK